MIISFSSTARIILKLPHCKPLFTLACSEEHVISNCYIFFVDERYNVLYIARKTVAVPVAIVLYRLHQSRLSVDCRKTVGDRKK